MNTKQKPQAGEVWIADFGIIGKIRPVLVLYYPTPEDSRKLVIVLRLRRKYVVAMEKLILHISSGCQSLPQSIFKGWQA